MLERLYEHLDPVNNGRTNNQFGFEKGVSSLDVIGEITQMAHHAARGAVQNRDICTVFLNVRNALNTAPKEI